MEYPIDAGVDCKMKTFEKPMKTEHPIVPRVGNFYIVRSGSLETVEKQASVQTPQKPTAQRISAEEAAQRIVQQFGRSLAVLAD